MLEGILVLEDADWYLLDTILSLWVYATIELDDGIIIIKDGETILFLVSAIFILN